VASEQVAEHYWSEMVPRKTDLTALLNDRWRAGWSLEHMTSLSWGALIAQSSTMLVLVWARREAVAG
jgi:hypothetical protein